MKIADPKVTLADEGRTGVNDQVRSGFLDWRFVCAKFIDYCIIHDNQYG